VKTVNGTGVRGSIAPGHALFLTLSCVLAAACVFLFGYRLADRDLWSSHEARAGMDAQSVLDGGGALPHLFDGRAELQKPPLYYWLVAGVARLRGGAVDAWAVRLPAAAAALLCVGAVVAPLWRRRPAGLLAGLVLATAAHFTWLARIGRVDMPLTLCVTVAAGGYYLARDARRQGGAVRAAAWLVAACLAVAAGVLLKGPIALVLPAAVVVAHLLAEGELPPPWRVRACGALAHELGLWWGLPLVAALAAPWFFWLDAASGGEFVRVFFWHHNVERGLGGSSLRTNPWWFYLPQFAVDFLPWSPLLAVAALWCWRRGYWRLDGDARFGLAWFAAVLLVLSCSHFKRADYLLPAYPGAALFLACVWCDEAERCRGDRCWGPALALLPAALAVGMVLYWGVRVGWSLPAREPFRDYRAFAAEVRRRAPAPQPVYFFRTEAHALALHLGRPLAVLVQWEELRRRLLRPGTHYVVLPPDCAAAAAAALPGVRLEEVLRNTDLSGGAHERPLVLLRARASFAEGP
jgi:4-amino-4-deoxy-L-arabinose transferase-like glycosyltransferase